ncbi:MAG: aminomethyl-transferring glycine dehydrogenase subunit GcvPA [Candidatus Aminicenantales bacterium]
MSYISLSDKDKKEMLARIGVSSTEELFSSLPKEIRLNRGLKLPPPLSEPELIRLFEEIAGRNTGSRFLSFLGAGAYSHFIPSVVDYLSMRGEFVTPYTPYQPEVSQGTLQIIFEFQTLICQLTGLDIANASLYDGASAAAEAGLMAQRLNGKPRILVARSLHSQYRETIRTYTRNLAVQTEEVKFAESGEVDREDLSRKLDKDVSAFICQSPNFFGVIENIKEMADLVHSHQALFIVTVAEGASLGILEAPGRLGADIVCGEGQSFGLPLSFGGPYLGFMACKKDYVRQLPGRIAGEARDVDGNRGFVLTLSTREQHIRREKATSNICTNQAWCALRATIFLETLGGEGLKELAAQNIQKANYAVDQLVQLKGVKRKFRGSVFNECVLEFSRDPDEINDFLREKGIIGGLSLSGFYPELRQCALFCVTEVHTKEEIDRLADFIGESSK